MILIAFSKSLCWYPRWRCQDERGK